MTEPKPEHTLSFEELTQGQPELAAQREPQAAPMEQTTAAIAGQAYHPQQPVVPTPAVTQVAASPPVQSTAPEELACPQESVKTNVGGKMASVAQAHKHRLRPLAYGLGSFVLFLVLFNFQLIAQQIGYFLHPPKPADNLTLQDPNAVTTNASIVGPESIIVIPKINVSAPIVYADSVSEADVLKDLESGVVHYANTAKPGENGNAVIFGHSSNDWWESGNYKFVFALLNKLEVGDQVQINYSSRKYVYEVTEKKVVAPTEVSVLNQTPNPVLTLITCTPPGTAWQRLIVVAKQIQPVPSVQPAGQVASAQKPANQTPQTLAKQALPSNSASIGDQLGSLWNNVVAFFSPKPAQQDQPATSPSGQKRLPEVS